jgi:hypothetical protein
LSGRIGGRRLSRRHQRDDAVLEIGLVARPCPPFALRDDGLRSHRLHLDRRPPARKPVELEPSRPDGGTERSGIGYDERGAQGKAAPASTVKKADFR